MNSTTFVILTNLVRLIQAAAQAGDGGADVVRGAVLLNCAGGMNSKFILDLPDWRYVS